MPLSASELHAAARHALDPTLRDLGFGRVPKTSTAAWIRPEASRWLMLWFQPDRWNGPQSAGFKFTVELRLAEQPVLYAAGRRARLPALLEPDERERLRQMENRVLARLPGPDRGYLRSLPDSLREALLADRKPRLVPYPAGLDVWFRHQDRDDVDALLALIVEVLPSAIDRFLAGDPEAGPGE
jgi:hypothetical protein